MFVPLQQHDSDELHVKPDVGFPAFVREVTRLVGKMAGRGPGEEGEVTLRIKGRAGTATHVMKMGSLNPNLTRKQQLAIPNMPRWVTVVQGDQVSVLVACVRVCAYIAVSFDGFRCAV